MRGVGPGRLALGIWLATLASAAAADRPGAGASVPLDPFEPTAPRGLAADLPRSPVADALVNGALRFSTAAEAQRHCPGDTVVRVEPWSPVYHPADVPGPGAFLCKAAALQEGDRPR